MDDILQGDYFRVPQRWGSLFNTFSVQTKMKNVGNTIDYCYEKCKHPIMAD